jgi:methylmalonyl-CoA decarboxylase
MALVETALEDAIGTLILAHDERRNALGRALIDDLLAGLAGFEKARVRAVLLRARPGARVFSAGHDIAELPRGGGDPLAYDDPLERLLRAVKRFPAPVIVMLHGSVWGGACDLVLSCDLVVGDPTCSFAITPANLGLPYNATGILQFMSRIPLHVAKEMFFTAAPVLAEAAHHWGILNHLVPEADLEHFSMELARTIASKAPLSVAVMKEQLQLLVGARPISPEAFERVQEHRRRVYESSDYREGIRAFEEKRKPVFKGE